VSIKTTISNWLIKIYTVWVKIKWSPYNPWSMALLNLAYQRYKETYLYRERRKFIEETKERNPILYDEVKNLMIEAFVTNGEVFFFMKKLTLKDRLWAIIAPFSIKGPFGLIMPSEEE